jgi:hypothetical protein
LSCSRGRKRTEDIFALDTALALEHNVQWLWLVFSAWLVVLVGWIWRHVRCVQY